MTPGRNFSVHRLFAALAALAVLATCCCTLALRPAQAASPPSPALDTYTFGVFPQRSALLTALYWNPILGYVSRHTGIRLDLKIARSAVESDQAAAKGEYDFVYSNTIFQPAIARNNYRVFLRARDASITSQIVTLNDSPIQTLQDLAGKPVGFPSQAAFAGYAVAMDRLRRMGIAVIPQFGGNEEGIMAQLKVGKVAAAGVNSQVMRTFASRSNLRYRVLWESGGYPNYPIAAHPRVPLSVVQAVQMTLHDMDHNPEGEKILQASAQVIGLQPPYGFRVSSSADYRNYSDFYRSTLVKDIK
ncbi:MAG: phosphate/phosphite/phosphonate ABC transporter substrate-binding protein [Betaproteobacteria bacterium]|nr:phosphate/phosphite/phosphonate ABC transporter substrate-binding protein [Betaproteobacteria bacterium]